MSVFLTHFILFTVFHMFHIQNWIHYEPMSGIRLDFCKPQFVKNISKIAIHFPYHKISGNTLVPLIAKLFWILRLLLTYEASVNRNWACKMVAGTFFAVLHGGEAMLRGTILLGPIFSMNFLDHRTGRIPSAGGKFGSPTWNHRVWSCGGETKLVPFSS